MKQKIKLFLAIYKGTISLFVITLAVTLVTAIVCSPVAGACVGTLSLVGITYLAEKVGMMLGDSQKPGIVGIALGVLISLI